MKTFSMLSAVATLAASVSAAAVPSTFKLTAKADDGSVGGALVPYHEGAGISIVFASAADASWKLNGSTICEASDAQYPMCLSVWKDGLAGSSNMTPLYALQIQAGDEAFSFGPDNELLYNGAADKWLACHDIGDPYHYSQWSIAYKEQDCMPVNCTSVKIYK